ncbi:MAG TPA: PadR family transcriptional regulator [Gemmatimonadaceae bacterium]|nr:PadR family transcriptional regulator [Gemmatimonadaceae bacterium]
MAKGKTELLAGTLDLIVLRLLQGGPANGWELSQRILAVSRDVLQVKIGSLYPALYRLEAREWIKSEWGTSENNRRAKYYSLTAAGRKQLNEEHETWKRFAAALELILRTG